jgi:hypothetical protein
MAVDDVTTVMSANLAAAGTVDRQPASGVEELCLDIAIFTIEGSAPNGVPACALQRIDGTNNEALFINGNTGLTATIWFTLKMMADNTNYFRFTNNGSQGDLSFALIVVG